MSRASSPPRLTRLIGRPPAQHNLLQPPRSLARWLIAACLAAALLLSFVITWSVQAGRRDAPVTETAAVAPAATPKTPPAPPALEPGRAEGPVVPPRDFLPLEPDFPLPEPPLPASPFVKPAREPGEVVDNPWETLDITPRRVIHIEPADLDPIRGDLVPAPKPEILAARAFDLLATPADPRLVACSKIGTNIAFFKDPPDAFRSAQEERKMVFFIHLSGNFEDSGFT